jgi:hypothetical protein
MRQRGPSLCTGALRRTAALPSFTGVRGRGVLGTSAVGGFPELRAEGQIIPSGDGPPAAGPVGCPWPGPFHSSLGPGPMPHAPGDRPRAILPIILCKGITPPYEMPHRTGAEPCARNFALRGFSEVRVAPVLCRAREAPRTGALAGLQASDPTAGRGPKAGILVRPFLGVAAVAPPPSPASPAPPAAGVAVGAPPGRPAGRGHPGESRHLLHLRGFGRFALRPLPWPPIIRQALQGREKGLIRVGNPALLDRSSAVFPELCLEGALGSPPGPGPPPG